jgi:serine O-acetyltransferase
VSIQPWTDAIEMARARRITPNWKGALRMMHTDAYILLLLFRLRKMALRFHIPLLNWPLRIMQFVFGSIELGNQVTLGDGVYFIHSLGVVVGGDARVGARVRFMGNNTVGTASDNGYPTIEDDVEVGCGARILGPIRIGAKAVIGANSVVLADVPAGAVAVGAPARIITPTTPKSAPALHLVVNGELER